MNQYNIFKIYNTTILGENLSISQINHNIVQSVAC